MNPTDPGQEELRRFWVEAAELMGIQGQISDDEVTTEAKARP
jgi:hypothetical protein